jgi:hypothetical protein
MKKLLIFCIMAILQACNSSVKPSEVNDTEKEPKGDIDIVVNDTNANRPLFTPGQEAKIKEDSLLRVQQKFPYLLKHPFAAYKAPVFDGAPAAPDFKNNPYANDSEYVAFIKNGCKKGINFGGHYTLIHQSCGAMCEFLFIVDRKNGKIFITDVGLGRPNGYYGFAFKKDSYALITDATAILDASTDQMGKDASIPMVYKWNGSRFIKLK